MTLIQLNGSEFQSGSGSDNLNQNYYNTDSQKKPPAINSQINSGKKQGSFPGSSKKDVGIAAKNMCPQNIFRSGFNLISLFQIKELG